MSTKSKLANELKKQNADAFNGLCKCLAEQQPLAMVGSGLVMSEGYPSWAQLIEMLHEKSTPKMNVGPARSGSLKKLDDLLFRAELYRQVFKNHDGHLKNYEAFLKSTFKPPKTPVNDVLKKFVRLKTFSHFVTTNYDSSLERALGSSPTGSVEWIADKDRRNEIVASLGSGLNPTQSVIHLHGIWNDAERIVLTEEDYLDRYVRSDESRLLLFAMFATKSVVFVGFGLGDPDLMQLMRVVASAFTKKRGRHFAILAHDPTREHPLFTRERLVQKYDITPVFYPWTPTHGHLGRLLNAIHKRDASLLPDVSFEEPVQPAATKVSLSQPKGKKRTARRDPDDPQKGQWGGKSVRNGREIVATVKRFDADWFEVKMVVSAIRGSPDFGGTVMFHLHDTFPEMDEEADLQNARTATLTKYCYGAFTVGVDIENEETQLELNLSKLKKAPMAFKKS